MSTDHKISRLTSVNNYIRFERTFKAVTDDLALTALYTTSPKYPTLEADIAHPGPHPGDLIDPSADDGSESYFIKFQEYDQKLHAFEVQQDRMKQLRSLLLEHTAPSFHDHIGSRSLKDAWDSLSSMRAVREHYLITISNITERLQLQDFGDMRSYLIEHLEYQKDFIYLDEMVGDWRTRRNIMRGLTEEYEDIQRRVHIDTLRGRSWTIDELKDVLLWKEAQIREEGSQM